MEKELDNIFYDQFYLTDDKDVICTLRIVIGEKGNYFKYSFDNEWGDILSNSDFIEEDLLVHSAKSGYSLVESGMCQSVLDYIPEEVFQKYRNRMGKSKNIVKPKRENRDIEIFIGENSKLQKNEKTSIYYLGIDHFKDINEVKDILKKVKIKTIIDIRDTVPEFGLKSKKFLKNEFSNSGMIYHHYKKIGNPFDERLGFKDKDQSMEQYKSYLRNNKSTELFIKSLRRLYKKNGFPAVMICSCEDFNECHIRILEKEIEMKSKLKVRHIDKNFTNKDLFN